MQFGIVHNADTNGKDSLALDVCTDTIKQFRGNVYSTNGVHGVKILNQIAVSPFCSNFEK